MKLEIEVIRDRRSVTQGEASVYVNGQKMISFGDDIQMIQNGRPYYGENIQGWASTKSDAEFITGLLWHLNEDEYISRPLRELLDKSKEKDAKRFRY